MKNRFFQVQPQDLMAKEVIGMAMKVHRTLGAVLSKRFIAMHSSSSCANQTANSLFIRSYPFSTKALRWAFFKQI